MNRLKLFKGTDIFELTCNLEKGSLVDLSSASNPAELYRLLIFVDNDDELPAKSAKALAALRSTKAIFEDGIYFNPRPVTESQACLLFPGQGSQYLGMLDELKRVWPGFNSTYFSFNEILSRIAGRDFNEIISLPASPEKEKRLKDTRNAQPALALCSSALVMALKQLNICPQFAAGHSFGELGALWAAEAFSLEALFRLALARGELFNKADTMAPGSMLSIMASHEQVQQLLTGVTPPVYVANINSPQQTIVAGSVDGIHKVYDHCRNAGIRALIIPTSGAFHSPYMQPVQAPWGEQVDHILAHATNIRLKKNVISSIDGNAYDEAGADLADRLTRQMTHSMDWIASCHALSDQGVSLFIEVGPSLVLTKIMSSIFPEPDAHMLCLHCDTERKDPGQHLIDFLAKLYVSLVPRDRTGIERLLLDLGTVPTTISKVDSRLSSDIVVDDSKSTERTLGRHFIDSNSKAVEAFLASQDKILDLVAANAEAINMARQNQLLSTIATTNSDIIKEYFELQSKTMALLAASGGASNDAKNSRDESPFSALRIKEPKASSEVPQPIVQSVAQNASSPKAWLVRKIGEITGIPADAIKDECRFEADLGLDSLRIIELFGEFGDQFPQYKHQQVSQIGCIGDIFKEPLHSDAKPLKIAQDSVERREGIVNPHVEAICSNIRERLALAMSVPVATIKDDDDFYGDMKLNAFIIDQIISEIIEGNPKLIFFGQELSNVSSLLELKTMLAKCYDDDDEKRASGEEGRMSQDFSVLDDKAAYRFIIADSQTFQIPVQASLARTLLLVGEDNQFYRSFEHKITKLLKVERLYFEADSWYSPKLNKRIAANDEVALGQLIELINGGDTISAAIFLAASPYTDVTDVGVNRTEIASIAALAGARFFLLAKALSPLIKSFHDSFTLGTVTRDSDFIAWYAVEGVAKALAREWRNVRVKHLRMHCELQQISDINLLRMLLSGPSECNVSLEKDGFKKALLQRSVLDMAAGENGTPFTENDIVICTGGGRGITAQAAMMLAKNYRCHIVAIGATEMPTTLPFQGVDEAQALYDAVQASLRRNLGQEPLPKAVREAVNLVTRQRELHRTARAIEQAQGRFTYYKADVRSREQLEGVIQDVKAKYGSIKGIIHGAGLIKDALIEKKSLEDFETVFQTKVDCLTYLKELTAGEPLQLVIIFSSIVAFTGTPGQTDYVAGNVVLNHMARDWNRTVVYPVKAILWSAWTETGLITDGLRRLMGNMNLHGISNGEGTSFLEREIRLGRKEHDLVLCSTGSVLKYTLSSDNAN